MNKHAAELTGERPLIKDMIGAGNAATREISKGVIGAERAAAQGVGNFIYTHGADFDGSRGARKIEGDISRVRSSNFNILNRHPNLFGHYASDWYNTVARNAMADMRGTAQSPLAIYASAPTPIVPGPISKGKGPATIPDRTMRAGYVPHPRDIKPAPLWAHDPAHVHPLIGALQRRDAVRQIRENNRQLVDLTNEGIVRDSSHNAYADSVNRTHADMSNALDQALPGTLGGTDIVPEHTQKAVLTGIGAAIPGAVAAEGLLFKPAGAFNRLWVSRMNKALMNYPRARRVFNLYNGATKGAFYADNVLNHANKALGISDDTYTGLGGANKAAPTYEGTRKVTGTVADANPMIKLYKNTAMPVIGHVIKDGMVGDTPVTVYSNASKLLPTVSPVSIPGYFAAPGHEVLNAWRYPLLYHKRYTPGYHYTPEGATLPGKLVYNYAVNSIPRGSTAGQMLTDAENTAEDARMKSNRIKSRYTE